MEPTARITIRAARQAGPFLIREIAYPPGFRQPRHSHPSDGVTLLLSGVIRESARWGEEVGTALSVVAKPAGVVHADEVGPHGARTVQVVFRDASLEGLTGWRWLHARPAAAAMLAILRAMRTPGAAPGAALEDRVIDVLACLPDDSPLPGHPPRWLRVVREMVDDAGGHETVFVRDLARAAGVHPVSLSRAFRRQYGCTVTEYRRRQRLRRAAASISAASAGLSRIAHESGYADHPHMTREFRRATGISPSRFRALIPAG